MRFRPVFFMGPGGRKVEAGRWPARDGLKPAAGRPAQESVILLP